MPVLDVDYSLALNLPQLRYGGCRENEARAYVSPEDLFQRKFRHWRGRSGRSHAFSVYAPADCPAYADAVLIVAPGSGARAALACVDLGPFPEATLARLRQSYAGRLDEVEFHVHVLADRAADRRTLIADLAPGEA